MCIRDRYWDSRARGALLGVSRADGKAEIVRACVDCIAYQIADVVRACLLYTSRCV